MNGQYTNKIRELIKKGLDNIIDSYREVDGKCGWHQYLGSSKIGNVASSQAILLLDSYGLVFAKKSNAIESLCKMQKKTDKEYLNGGWSYITNLSEVPLTESTSWALLALKNQSNIPKEIIDNGLKWLLVNKTLGSEDVGWGCTKKDEPRVYSTCIALKALKSYSKIESIQFTSALRWLKSVQNPDGGWGDKFGSRSTIIHTTHCILTLLELDGTLDSIEVDKGFKWIINTLQSDKIESNVISFGFVEFIDLKAEAVYDTEDKRITFYHMPLPYLVRTLLLFKFKDEVLLYEIIFGLVEQNNYGFWNHPFIINDKIRPLWAIYDVLQSFKFLQENSEQWDQLDANLQNIYQKIALKKDFFDAVIFTVVPVEFDTLRKIFEFDSSKKEYVQIDGVFYYEYIMERQRGKRALRILITLLGSAGDVNCALILSKTFERINCDTAILCGIAAGVEEEITKYSCVVATNIVNYEFQRIEKDGVTFRPKEYSVEIVIERLITQLALKLNIWKEEMVKVYDKLVTDKEEFPISEVENIRIKGGVLASGAKLMADGKYLESLRNKIPIEKGIIGAEMEGSGFAPACQEYRKPWLVFRGISDFGGEDKNSTLNKKYQFVAAASAGMAVMTFLTSIYMTASERRE